MNKVEFYCPILATFQVLSATHYGFVTMLCYHVTDVCTTVMFSCLCMCVCTVVMLLGCVCVCITVMVMQVVILESTALKWSSPQGYL